MNLIRKEIAVGIILLFIGIAVTPSINFNVVKASSEDEFVEVTSQACGIKGFGDNTVKLRKQQYRDLEQYLADFRERLNKTTTREEAVPIFNEAVVELNKYGLLPKGMSIEQAQKLVTGGYQNSRLMNLIEKRFSKNLAVFNNSNFICLIAGQTDLNTYFQNPIGTLLWYLSIIPFLFGILIELLTILGSINQFFPISLHQRIGLGGYDPEVGGHSPTYGWLYTQGLLGIKKWNGNLFGALHQPVLIGVFGDYYPAVCGFMGLRIFNFDSLTYLFYGTAIKVKISFS